VLAAVVRGSGIAILIQVLGIGLSYGLQVLLARLMGSQAYGVYAYVTTLALLLSTFTVLGFPTAALRFVSEYTMKEQWGHLRGFLRSSALLMCITSLLVALCGSAVIFWGQTSNDSGNIAPMLIGMALVPLLALEKMQTSIFRGIKHIALAVGPLKILWPLLFVVGVLSCYLSGYTPTSTLVVSIAGISLLVLQLTRSVLLRQKMPGPFFQAKPVYEIRMWLRVSLPMFLAGIFMVVLNRTDVILLGALQGYREVGLYSVAERTATLVSFILTGVNAIVAPTLVTLHAERGLQGLEILLLKTAHLIFWPSLLISIGLIVFSDSILRCFGEEFVAVRWEMIILIGGQLVNSGVGSVGVLLDMMGYQRENARVCAVGALANIVLNAIGIPLFGITGAALAAMLTMVLWNVWLYTIAKKKLNIQMSIVDAIVLHLRKARP
jgi:O-antigen/teichoic acid export membrane protein